MQIRLTKANIDALTKLRDRIKFKPSFSQLANAHLSDALDKKSEGKILFSYQDPWLAKINHKK